MPVQRTILIVDDDPQIRTLCGTILEESGYRVRKAADGKDALAAIAETAFDLIVLDLCMPGTDGFEFLQAVRADLPKLKVVVMSGFMSATMLPVAKLSGAAATLAKPFSPESLLSVVRQALPEDGPVRASG
jgi:DNA-binding NtrC family response regulator